MTPELRPSNPLFCHQMANSSGRFRGRPTIAYRYIELGAPVAMPDRRADEFVAIYTRHERQLYRYVAALLAHPDDAEDILQETARILWQKFDQYRPEEPFLPWACKIAHFEVLNFCQKERTRHKHFQPTTVEVLAETRLQHSDLFEAQSRWLAACLGKLPDADSQLIKRRYGSKNTLADLAQEIGRTPNVLYKSLQRVRRTLLDCIRNGLQSDGWV
jgi:RNA polymerase sigma-70 factor, ECF subfamily